ncbi:MAG: hypothetical protein V2I40_04075 [Desulfobacteraceae bacterium]|jgi:hypothetical protein|nr:hypothetical protein [Desulfobacteraceae bacterium]
MKTKMLLISLVIALFASALASSSALAGSKQKHRWEGVAIGVGAAILGHAIYQAHQQPRVVYVEPERTCRDNRRAEHRHGHWTWQKTWVPPTYERVWNPGHYNRKGHWVSGHWIEVETSDGHWIQERVWVANQRGRY